MLATTLFTNPSMLLQAWTSGLVTGLGLFAVVGAQSAFIIRQGIARAHVPAIVLLCATIDVFCIFASVWGLQHLAARFPWFADVLPWVGAVFLGWYGLRSFQRAFAKYDTTADSDSDTPVADRHRTLLAAAGFTLLNPHFWLDMFVLGSLAATFGHAKVGFAAGASAASILWLAALGFGARALSPLMKSRRAWQVMDAVIGAAMWGLAVYLIR